MRERDGWSEYRNQGKMTIQQVFLSLGHANEDVTRKTAKILGWKLQPGSLNACETCTAAKAKQNILKTVPYSNRGTQ